MKIKFIFNDREEIKNFIIGDYLASLNVLGKFSSIKNVETGEDVLLNNKKLDKNNIYYKDSVSYSIIFDGMNFITYGRDELVILREENRKLKKKLLEIMNILK